MTHSKHVVLLKSRISNLGGLEKYAARIASGFLDKGCKVSLLTSGDSSPLLNSIEVHVAKTCRWPGFWRMEQYDRFTREWLKEHPVDILFGMDRNRLQTHMRAGNGVHAAFLKSRILTQGRGKWLVCQANPLHRKVLQLEKTGFENPALKKLFTNSHMVKNEILHYYRTDPAKIEVVHNGVEWKEMQSDFDTWPEQKILTAKRLGLDPSRFHFLFIGNGYLRKGLGQLLKALASLKRKDVFLSILGKDNRIEEYRALASTLNLDDQVAFFGSQKEIRPFYQLADALAIPSFYDPFANVTVEALAMGLFVVSSKTNGGHEVLHEQNGAIIDDLLDTSSNAAALLKAISQPKTEKLAKSIRDSVRHLDFSNQMPLIIDSCLC
jgi:UDP-glucose:(heptosyl)LPS alpha-1,3-glucosyltransferase